VFSFEIWSTFVFLLFVSDAISNQFSINLLDCSRLQIGLLSYILTWFLFWGQKLEKSLLEISRFNLSTENGGILKMHFGELKMRLFPTAPIHIVCYIPNDFECLELSKYVLIWNMNYIRVPLFSSKSITTEISINLLEYSLLYIGLLSDILTWSLFWGPKE
jgi:hypothetical protein